MPASAVSLRAGVLVTPPPRRHAVQDYPISSLVVEYLVSVLLFLQYDSMSKPISLYINSPGAEVRACLLVWVGAQREGDVGMPGARSCRERSATVRLHPPSPPIVVTGTECRCGAV